ncbi:MAG: hypothetical protein DCF15_10465 [Phormidesmis priestleyi]|uniref:Uncharacterized protein n=1 Tax=Phormidesmis priestleyi TaxID=268141 RepID=A0A2W4XEP1_9CYAN|nr:MAG: hypothetical protein DCF15_10465 [Phormidesmis priestleyi]
MKQKEIIDQMAAGGYILNQMLIQPNRRAHPHKISDRQIKALENKGLVTKTVGYDKLQTYRLK